jgi:hypothetical protein
MAIKLGFTLKSYKLKCRNHRLLMITIPVCKRECNLFHVYNWIQFFLSMYNDTTSIMNYFTKYLNERGEYILN